MKKLTTIVLTGALTLSLGTSAFAKGTNNGNHNGWNNPNNPHHTVKAPNVDTSNPQVLTKADTGNVTVNTRLDAQWIKNNLAKITRYSKNFKVEVIDNPNYSPATAWLLADYQIVITFQDRQDSAYNLFGITGMAMHQMVVYNTHYTEVSAHIDNNNVIIFTPYMAPTK
ncbi:hypothetical protein NDK43_06695 [Neobacillus pocheonensis]|uniref:Uncharacterized protein n=1 Tax=Neobacillus pocheonensis TaxID=363869 RepID=A0ABT0W987_9BACI|nr:hypothetical protein [Neobacillus pocheonensis]